MIKKHNLLTLLESNNKQCYHSAILTCFSFDPIFFTLNLLPVIRSKRIVNVVVFMDASRYDVLMESFVEIKEYLQGYTLVRQPALSGCGVFHPKTFLFVGDKCGEVFIGSGNLTYSGISLNDEVWASFIYDGKDDMCLPIIKGVWDFFRGLSMSDLVRTQIESVEQNAIWLNSIDKTGNVIEKDGISYSLIYNQPDNSIFKQLKMIEGNEKVDKLIAISPFFDDEASVVSSFDASEAVLFIDSSNGRAPRHINDKYCVYDWASKNEGVRKLHAKIFQIETQSGTFLLVGSANATPNAFGMNHKSINDEMGVLIYSKEKKDFVSELGFLPLQRVKTEDLDKLENALPKTETVTYGVKIDWTEFKEGTLFLQIDKYDKSWRICIEDVKGFSKEFPFPDNFSLCELDMDPFVVYVKHGDNIISNRSLVVKEEDVLKSLPNSSLGKLSQLLKNPERWSKNIAEILENVYFEDTIDGKAKFNKEIKVSHSSLNVEDVVVLRENFDETPTSIKSKLALNKNLLILDFFKGLFGHPEQHNNVNIISEDDVVNEENVDDTLLEQRENIRREQTGIYSQVNWFWRKTIKEFYNKLENIPVQFSASSEKSVADLNQSCIPAIANDLIILENLTDPKKVGLRRKQFLELVTLTCLVFRDGIIKTDRYTEHKILSNLKYFVNKSLLLFAHFSWPCRREMYTGILNVIFLLRHIEEKIEGQIDLITKSMDGLFNEAERNRLSINDDSVKFLYETISVYTNFFSVDKQKNLKTITDVEEGVDIVKVQKLCFALIGKVWENKRNCYQYCYQLPIDKTLPECSTTGKIACLNLS